MPLTSIVIVVLRLFSILWLVQGLAAFAAQAAVAANTFGPSTQAWMYLAPILYLFMAVATWLLAPFIGRSVTPAENSSLSVGSLDLHDLYRFAFVFLGIYFFLTSVGAVVSWLHYFIQSKTAPMTTPERGGRFYEFTQPLVTLVAGGACLAFAPQLTRKIAAAHEKRVMPDEPAAADKY